MKFLPLMPARAILAPVYISGALAWLLVAAQVALAQGPGITVSQIQTLPSGARFVLTLPPPDLTEIAGPDGKPYTQARLPANGTENAPGRPALPFVRHVAAVQVGLRATARVQEVDWHEMRLPSPLWPVQPPVPKLPGAVEKAVFQLDPTAYSGAHASEFQRSTNLVVETLAFRRRGQDFVEVTIRPFAYRAADRVLRCPAQLVVDLDYSAPALPPAAGPRTGRVIVLEVKPRTGADVEWLRQEGFNYEVRGDGTAEVHATEAEALKLKDAGLECRELPARPSSSPPRAQGLGDYNSFGSITSFLQQTTNQHPSLCRLISIGRTVQDREMWALKVTTQPDLEMGKPRVRLGASIHGDEPLGAEMCLYFIDLLANGSVTNARISNLLARTEIWVIPVLNPDGFVAGTRFNSGGYDLNRSFPDSGGSGLGNSLFGPPAAIAGRPPEVVNLMRFSTNRTFTLAANLHGGALVANYPFDDDELGAVNSPTPDDALFRFIALAYATHNPPMYASSTFSQGIVNGAAWYVVDGGLQDWSYRYAGCNEVTIEISNNKQPPAVQLLQYWNDNREAMLSYVETVYTAINGFFTDAESGQPVHAAVKVLGAQHGIFSDRLRGDYHRMLRPGTYHLAFTAPHHLTKVISNVVVQAGAATRLDVALSPSARPHERILLVGASSLAPALPGLAARKRADGFDVLDMVVPDGTASERIRHPLRDAWAVFPADYVILVGDSPQIPPFQGTHPTDLPFALMDAGETATDYLGKDTLLGRLSLTNTSALGLFANKMAAYSRTRTNRAGDLTWISGGATGSEYDQAERGHDYCITNCVPPNYGRTLFYEGVGSELALNGHINAGTDGVIYSGHGSEYNWMRFNYSLSSLAALTNLARAPVVIGHCCLAGSFQLPVCFAEAWLQTSSRGITYVGASDNTYWDEDEWMQMAEFDAMSATAGVSVSKAVEEGLYRVHQLSPSMSAYYYSAYHVFGDPTTVLFETVPLPLTVRSGPTLPSAGLGFGYSFGLRATGGEPPYTWTLESGVLPDGLALSPDGTISGTPGNEGLTSFVVLVTDSSSPPGTTRATLELAVVDTSAAFNLALETTNWPWSTDIVAPWLTQSATTHDGVDAAQSAPVLDSQSTYLETVVNGPGLVTFWWKVSSEPGYDFLEFQVNGQVQPGRITGEIDWQLKSFTVGDGPQTLRWRYTKDGSLGSGQDRGWLDQVRFVPLLEPVLLVQPTNTIAFVGDPATLTASVVGATPLAFQWYHNDSPVNGAINQTLGFSIAQPGDSGEYWLVVSNGFGVVTSTVVRLSVVTGISLAEALEQPSWAFNGGGKAVWRGQSVTSYDAEDAAQSGEVGDNEDTWMETTVIGPGELGFWWKVSSESGYDFLDVLTNGLAAGPGISGSVDWQWHTLRLGEGATSVRWIYSKDISVSSGLDSAWVDGLSWAPDSPAPTIVKNPSDTYAVIGHSAAFAVQAGGAKPLTYQWYKGEIPIQRASTPGYAVASAQFEDAGVYSVVVSNSSGAVTSAPARLAVVPASAIATNSFAATDAIAIPALGSGTPYPSTIEVSGLDGIISKVTVKLTGFTHTYPADVCALVTGPSGPSVMLMGSAGGGSDASNLALAFDDEAAATLTTGPLADGSYRPTDLSGDRLLPAPAPGRPFAGELAAFNGALANGAWRLFVCDLSDADSGMITSGWRLELVTVDTNLPPVLPLPVIRDGEVRLEFPTRTGKFYQVQARDAEEPDVWKPLCTVAGDGAIHSCIDALSDRGAKLYRLFVY